MDRGLASAVEVLMERESITRDEAIEKLKQVAEDNALIASLGLAPAAPDPNQATPPADGEPSLGGEAAGGGAEDED
jgi:hypothetical protein